MKRSLIYIILASVFGVLLFVLEWQKPDEVSWKESYSEKDRIPFGNYVLYDLLSDIFPDAPLEKSKKRLRDLQMGIEEPTNFIFISDNFNISPSEFENFLFVIKEGSDVFIASEHLPEEIAFRYGVRTEKNNISFDKHGTPGNNYLRISYDEKLSKVYNYKAGVLPLFYSDYNKETGDVVAVNHDGKPVVLKFKEGKGHVYLSCVPKAFTNYNMLYKDNYEFISGILSFMPVRPVVWDEYYKPGNKASSSPLRFILGSKSLKMAWFTLLAAMALYLFSEVKRRQRIIPVITPPNNTSVEFAETLGHLYFHYKNHKNLAEKRVLYFLDKVKNMFHIPLREKDSDVRERLIRKDVAPKRLINQLFEQIKLVRTSDKIIEKDLLKLNQLMDEFDEEVRQKNI